MLAVTEGINIDIVELSDRIVVKRKPLPERVAIVEPADAALLQESLSRFLEKHCDTRHTDTGEEDK